MQRICPSKAIGCKENGKIIRFGHYYRTSDRRSVQRFRCTHCKRNFSVATTSICFGQNKRHLNHKIWMLLVSGVSQRRAAKILNTRATTVAEKLKFLALHARKLNLRSRFKKTNIRELQFDDLETFEHTKLKPISVTLAVEKETRFIVGFEVSRMPAKGLLVKRSAKKYGYRKDERSEGRSRLFRKIKSSVLPTAVIQSDQNPHYPESVREHFPLAEYLTVKGLRGCITGQGELKATSFDPLFSLNHTCAMLRANINRLFRKTWCTTKKPQGLIDHLEIYVLFHNMFLI